MSDRAYDALEISRIIGQPVDPRKPYPTIVNEVCDIDTADPDEYVYAYDVLQDTEKIHVLTSSGAVTQEVVSPDTPTLISFVDVASQEYYVKLVDLAKAKERVLARKKATINRAMNAWEEYKVIELLASATTSTGNENTLRSGYTKFVWPDLIDMLDQIQDYGDSYVLIQGTNLAKDMVNWNWDNNKYHDLTEAFNRLNISTVRMPTTMNFYLQDDDTSGSTLTATDVLSSNVGYLVARSTEVGKPGLFVRKNLNAMESIGGIISMDGDAPQRLVFVSPNPITVTSTARYLAVGLTGFEEIATFLKNEKAVSKFTRT